MSAIINCFSAIGNNSSIYPLLVRDCGIEIPSKVLIARNENLKESREIANDATRERLIDEYGTSAVWLGGIPAVEAIADKIIEKRGFSAKINPKLFKETEEQGILTNIKKFENSKSELVKKAVEDLKKASSNKKIFENLQAGKFVAAVIIPTTIMGFILPPLNFALTRKIREKKAQQNQISQDSFVLKNKVCESAKLFEPTFNGSFAQSVAGLSTTNKMAITDGGLTVGRVSTSRNKDEAYVNAFRMIGSMILNFVTPIYIEKLLDKSANKIFNLNVNLDPKILNDKEFINSVKGKKLELPKSNKAKDLIDFIDENPNSIFAKSAQRTKILTYLEDKDSNTKIRDPRKFVDIKKLQKLKEQMESYKNLASKAKDIEKFAQKAKYVKCINILANVGISSFLLAVVLPKAQYLFTKFLTGSYNDPGLRK